MQYFNLHLKYLISKITLSAFYMFGYTYHSITLILCLGYACFWHDTQQSFFHLYVLLSPKFTSPSKQILLILKFEFE
jgi:hypothetical protein